MTQPNDPVYINPDIPKGNWKPSDIELFEKYGKGGLTKREYFAAMALLQLVNPGMEITAGLARLAVETADSLIKELNK